MALEQCRECAKDFSTRASQCPHCGAKRTTLAAKGCLAMVGLFVLLVIIGLLRPDDPPPTPETPAQIEAEQKELQDCKYDLSLYEAARVFLDYKKGNLVTVGPAFISAAYTVKQKAAATLNCVVMDGKTDGLSATFLFIDWQTGKTIGHYALGKVEMD